MIDYMMLSNLDQYLMALSMTEFTNMLVMLLMLVQILLLMIRLLLEQVERGLTTLGF